MKNNKTVVKTLNKELLKIRGVYKAELRKPKGEFSLWLCDNYYLIERHGRDAAKSLLQSLPLSGDETGMPVSLAVCLSLTEKGELPSQEEICKAFTDAALSTPELSTAGALIKTALIFACANACETQSAELLSESIKTLSKIGDIDFEEILVSCSPAESILATEKCGIYPRMSEQTRAKYRRAVCLMAAQSGMSEEELARSILIKADNATGAPAHVGEYIEFGKSRIGRGVFFLFLEVFFPVLLCALAGVIYKSLPVALLLLFPLWEAVKPVFDTAAMRKTEISHLPAMENSGRVPSEGKTVIAISCLLPSAGKSSQLKKHLEELKKTNGGQNVNICVLADLRSASVPEMPEDDADISASARIIESLNKKYGGGFLLAVRRRSYSSTQHEYTGSERKRGAIAALARAAGSEDAAGREFLHISGDIDSIHETRYICALDSDTRMPMDSVAELVAVAMHPLNRARLDRESGKIVGGYGIFAPSVGTAMAENASVFRRITGGDCGVSVYAGGVCERYQDLFGRGLFCGKGLIDVEAFNTVADGAFPAQKILSHDILEGELLRTAFVSQTEFSDDTPPDAVAYFRRQHRWIRGDWQNIAYIFGAPIGESGRRISFSALSRYKLFDNLRRSITPVCCMLLILLSPVVRDEYTGLFFAIGVAGAVAPGVISSVRSLWHNGSRVFSRRYYSGNIPVAKADLLRALLGLVLLPQNSYCCLSAIVTAVYRTAISKKKLLQWTVAADSNRSTGAYRFYLSFFPSFISGIYMTVFGNPFAAALGVLFILSAFIVRKMGVTESNGKRKPDESQRDRLLSYAASMWKYFDRFCRREDNYLPPDNMQESPVYRVAHRTSPTNIGLALLAFLCARDMGFIDSQALFTRVEETLSSVCRLEKYEGNLLNWYDTRTLAPLTPKYASSVDSGNFICCLITLRKGLLEYVSECPKLREQVACITQLICDTDISVFYNSARKLFSVGIDVKSGKLDDCYYDLLMSEARMLGYYAVSSRLVPKKHWETLGRVLAAQGKYTGPVSWTGTMFEYFLPSLFLPVYKGTLTYEALSFCAHCQKKRVRGKKAHIGGQEISIPFGISESAYYAFDSSLDYRYKAHGVQKTALKKGMNKELVISPYSSFILLPFQTESALKNLELLEKYDAFGEFGFYEALDFTSERLEGREYSTVKSYMAHHLGMSLLGVVNTLFDNSVRRRFTGDEEMAAGEYMLMEKIQSGAPVFRDVYEKVIPVKSRRASEESVICDNISLLSPVARIYANGEWSAVFTDGGAGFSMLGNLDAFRRHGDYSARNDGVACVFLTEDKAFSLTKNLDAGTKTKYSTEFTGNAVKYTAVSGLTQATQIISVLASSAGQTHTLSIKNNSKRKIEGRLRIFFEPSLACFGEERAHPAFSKLFIEAEYDRENAITLFKRLDKSTGKLSVLAAGLREDCLLIVSTNREEVLKRPEGVHSLLRSDMNIRRGVISVDKCFFCEIPVALAPGRQLIRTLIITGASSVYEAKSRLIRARSENTALAVTGAASLFNESSLEGIAANTALPFLFFGADYSREHTAAVLKNTSGIDTLWSAGISGDNPIVLVELASADLIENALPYCSLSRKLRGCSLKIDTVIAYSEGGEYGAPIARGIEEAVKLRLGNTLAECGVFAVNLNNHPPEMLTALKAAASYIAPLGMERLKLPVRNRGFAPILPVNGVSAEKNGFTEGAYRITEHPRLPWSHVICNRSFGTLLSDMSLGFSYAENSRENKLTPWRNDTAIDNRGELLLVKTSGNIYDAVQGADAYFYDGGARFEGTAGALLMTTSVSVAERGMCKFVKLKIKNTGDREKTVTALFYCEPICSSGLSCGENGAVLLPHLPFFADDCLSIRTHYNGYTDGYMSLKLCEGAELYTTDRTDVMSGNWKKSLSVSGGICAAVGGTTVIPAFSEKTMTFIMAYGHSLDSAVKLLNFTKTSAKPLQNSLMISTPDSELNDFFNTLLSSQVLSCRLFARVSFYQCSGAYGFRDQLQDSAGVVLIRPEICRCQIIRCCAVQFEQGDVLHWWHPAGRTGFRGVRTRCSDDLLWLPLTVAEYVKKTGDGAILDVEVAFLDGRELSRGEDSLCMLFSPSKIKGSVYEHCVKAFECAFSRGTKGDGTGENGLMLMLGGDWNDGFDSIGTQSAGESVWLSQFASLSATEFSRIAQNRGDTELAVRLKNIAYSLLSAVEKCAYNGKYYARAVLSDGGRLGDGGHGACAIDSLSQSFAVFSSAPDREKRLSAIEYARDRLADTVSGTVRLFSPPFTEYSGRIGYVTAYPAGVRENGGQYTHAAVWLARAFLKEGVADTGYELLKMLNPAEKYASGQGDKYMTEPYAICADVYYAPPASGRGGWSLYTGAASWYYRTVYEEILGIIQENGAIRFNPKPPSAWISFSARLTLNGAVIDINYEKTGENSLTVDGILSESLVPDGKNHTVSVKF